MDLDRTQTFKSGADAGPTVRRFLLTFLEPPGRAPWESTDDVCAIGSHASNDVVIDEKTVSRFHCELRIGPNGPEVRDLDSRNGTIVDGLRIKEAYLRDGSVLRLGDASMRFEFGSGENRLHVSPRFQFGGLSGLSTSMRSVFTLLEAASASDATILIEGETGTGKGAAAEAMHRESARSSGPFVVADCSAVAANLLESELFGHERGAFTGADSRRIGVFEAAKGGTIFLDEVGELPLDLQPKLLRALENREVKRLGSSTYHPIDVRVVAATNKNLRTEVNAGRFRSDLYYRLAVLKVVMPALRERPEDIPVLAEQLLGGMGVDAARVQELLTPTLVAQIQHSAWPGNVRELRNYLERLLVFRGTSSPGGAPAAAPASGSPVDVRVGFAEGRRLAVEHYERSYLVEILKQHKGSIPEAAAAAGVTRVHMWRLARRYQLID
jgi:transcriptional regulator with PAS, ATPase and Fis domain